MSDESKPRGAAALANGHAAPVFGLSRRWIVAALYVMSFGPACWITSRTGVGISAIEVAYQPIMRGVRGPFLVREIIIAYAEFAADPQWHFGVNGPVMPWSPVRWGP